MKLVRCISNYLSVIPRNIAIGLSY